jgi:hypothetical protein
LGDAILAVEGLQELKRRYGLEHDSNKKRGILEQLPALTWVGSEQLFSDGRNSRNHIRPG